MVTSRSSLLSEVARIAREAGAAIVDVYAREFDVAKKADSSPLTLADMRSHEIIVKALHALTPDVPILSEEASNIPFEERSKWTRYWLVDPLDGTKEFISRNGEFTVNIALIEEDRPVLGVVHIPALATTYSGIVGQSARLRRSGSIRPISARTAPRDGAIVLSSRSHGDADALDSFLAN